MRIQAVLLGLLHLGLCSTFQIGNCPPQCVCFGQSVVCKRLTVSSLPNLPHFLPEPNGGAMQYFSLTLTNLTHLIKGSFSGFLDLIYIDLSNNELSDVDEMAFENLPSLFELSLRQNRLTSLPDDMFDNIQSLTSLDLSINQLTAIPSSIQRLVHLQKLNIHTNPIHCPCSIVNFAMILPHVEQSYGRAQCASPPEVAGRSIAHIGQKYATAFENTAHLGFQPDVGLYPETTTRLRRTKSVWPLPHCREGYILDDNVKTGPNSAPMFKRPLTSITAAAGERVFFVCEVEGSPQPLISWALPTNQTSFIRLWDNRRILEVREVHDYYEGTFTCIARNRFGERKQAANLKMVNIVKPQIVEAPPAHHYGALPGSDLKLVCSAEGRPRPFVSWLWVHATSSKRISTEGRYVIRTQTRAVDSPYLFDVYGTLTAGEQASTTLIIRNITDRDTEGRYVCYAANHAGSARVSSVISLEKGVDDAKTDEMAIPDELEKEEKEDWGEEKENDIGSESNEELVKRVIERARKRIDKAIQATADKLRDPSNRRSASDIASLFRQPSKAAVELAKSAEIYEAALDEVTQILQKRQREEEKTLGKDADRIYRGDEDYNEQKRSAYGVQLTTEQLAIIAQLSGCAQSQRVEPCEKQLCFHLRYRSVDGSCNNLNYPRWGASLAPFYRLLPPVYENGVNTPVGWNPEKLYFGYPKPSARLVSYRLLGDATKLQFHTERLETFNMKVKMVERKLNQSSSIYDSPLFALSKTLFQDEDEEFSGFLMQWGQFLDHDLDFTPVDASTSRFSDGLGCNETCINDPPCFPILTPPGDPRIKRRCIGFARSSATCGSGSTSILLGRPQYREQLNQITAFIDASNVYASEEFESNQLRDTLYDEGRLREGMPTESGKKLLPFNIRGQVDCQADPQQDFVPCFKAGDHRSNENLGLISIHTIWMREHNRIADQLRSLNPHWSGNRIYQEGRKIVGALMQSITYRSWLPKILGPRGMEHLGQEYSGYDSSINPTISNEFATAAFRFGHTLVSPFIFRLNENWEPIPEGHLLLHKAFFAPDLMLTDGGIDPILRGLMFHGVRDIVRQPSLNPELTERLFFMAHQLALDLASLNIQRGRDHGFPHYTAYAHKVCNVLSSAEPSSFDDLADIIKSRDTREKMRSVYGHPANVDLFAGGILEDVLPGARMGPTFACIIADQFRRLRDGDRLWYEAPGQFTAAQLAELRVAGSSFSRVLCENGDNITEAQVDAFRRPKSRKDIKPCSEIPKLNLAPWKECPNPSSNVGVNFDAFNDVGQFTEESITRIRRSTESGTCNEVGHVNSLEIIEQEVEQRMKLRELELEREKLRV